MVKRGFKTKKKLIIQDTLPYKLLFINLIVLAILGGAMIFLGIMQSSFKDKPGFSGEFNVLKWGSSASNISLSVTGYQIASDNQTVNVTINWDSGNGNLSSLLMNFNKNSGNCNYTTSELPSEGSSRNYQISLGDTDCLQDFSDLTSITVTAGVDVVIEQTGDFEEVIIYIYENSTEVLDLDKFISCSYGGTTFSIAYPEDNILIDQNTANNISIYVDYGWFGEVLVNVLGSCASYPEVYLEDSFSVKVLNQVNPKANKPPVFLGACKDFMWRVNENQTIYLGNCFDNPDYDSLTFKIENNNSNIELTIKDYSLEVNPALNWVGEGNFKVYCSDGEDEALGRVGYEFYMPSGYVPSQNLTVPDSSSSQIGTPPSNLNPKIIRTNPVDSRVYIFADAKRKFTVTPENYGKVKWHLDDIVVKEDSLFYDFSESEGNHTLKVEIIKGDKKEVKIWHIFIEDEEYVIGPIFHLGPIIFYLIVVVLIIIILLVVWIFIAEKQKNKKIKPAGFGIEIKIKSKKGSFCF